MNKRLIISLTMLMATTTIGTFSFMVSGGQSNQSRQESADDRLLSQTLSLVSDAREELEQAIKDLIKFASIAGREQKIKLIDIIKRLRAAKEELDKYNPTRDR